VARRLLFSLDRIHIDARLRGVVEPEKERKPFFELTDQHACTNIFFPHGPFKEGRYQRLDATETEFDQTQALPVVKLVAQLAINSFLDVAV
jgi:hypothetical protein